MELYIGLMSGTSADGIDAALVDFSHEKPRVMATLYTPYTTELRKLIHELCEQGDNEIHRLGELDNLLGHAFATAVDNLLQEPSAKILVKAIGSHGQTVRHHPHDIRYTVQIGDPNIIAARTGITTVADFRRKDIALGGHGAPLVPAFHRVVFHSPDTHRIVVNIGGMANVTLLNKNDNIATLGFDTGPGNVLMDIWAQQHLNKNHDAHGAFAASGSVIPELLAQMLADPYFQLPPPKSTGREYFNRAWLEKHLAGKTYQPRDVQATLAELTARSIVDAIHPHIAKGELLICGGGTHNDFLMQRLAAIAQPDFSVKTTLQYGVDPDWVEAVAFAWLAKQTLARQPGNLPSVTGAQEAVVLGGVYYS